MRPIRFAWRLGAAAVLWCAASAAAPGQPTIIKWEQLPSPAWPGLHSHDYDVGFGPQYVRMADDFMCEGGEITGIEWWGNYEIDAQGNEMRGAGVALFELSLHMCNPAMPFHLPGPPMALFPVPFALVSETATGMLNSEGCMIYHYSATIPPIPQTAGEWYWLDVMARSVDLVNHPRWRWQEANRGPIHLGHAPAAAETESQPWQSVVWSFPPPESYSDMAFRIVSTEPAPPQACCLPDGTCVMLPWNDCVAAGGDPQGPGTDCTTVECWPLKWAQPPIFFDGSPHPECLWSWPEISGFNGPWFMADDWRCVEPVPVTDIHWWGTYLGWDQVDPPPTAPDLFHVGIWTDVPAGADLPFSHPGEMIWEFVVPRMMLNERPVACTFHPFYTPTPLGTFRYDLKLPPEAWFHQWPQGSIFWLSISAMYTMPEPEFPWGWNTRPHFFMDDAVRTYFPLAPQLGVPWMQGEPLIDFDGESWDLAFVLTTTDCPEDLDHDGVVGFSDLLILLSAWGAGPGHPADFDGNGVVDFGDLLRLLSKWGPC